MVNKTFVSEFNGNTYTWPFENVEPREVQLRALAKGYSKPGFAYFMRQRLGKTWVVYAEYTLLKNEGKVDWMFLICPNSLKKQFVDAIETVDMFTPICLYESAAKQKAKRFFSVNKKGGVFIVNYESLKTIVNSDLLDPVKSDRVFIVADESTKIKDPQSQATKHAVGLGAQCAYSRILTGRPTANSNLDIWAQLKFINGTPRNYFQHKYTFCVMGGFQGRQAIKDINTELLKAEIEPISYIAEDKYITGFEKIYEPLRKVNLSGNLANMYKKMEDDLIIELSGDENKATAPLAITKYLRLQQISSGIVGDVDGNQQNLVEPAHNPRIQVVRDIIETEITNKVIIVCRFKLSIHNIYHELTKHGYKVGIIAGGMEPDKIEDVKKQFNEGDLNIIVAQMQVLSFGHTLCATDENPCDSMIFYETDFSLINRAQCESRPEKMGRNKPISYYDMYASKMDRYMLQKLINKEEASLALMNYARTYGMRPEGLNIDDEKKEKKQLDLPLFVDEEEPQDEFSM